MQTPYRCPAFLGATVVGVAFLDFGGDGPATGATAKKAEKRLGFDRLHERRPFVAAFQNGLGDTVFAMTLDNVRKIWLELAAALAARDQNVFVLKNADLDTGVADDDKNQVFFA